MSDFKIEKGVSMDPLKTSFRSELERALNIMEVGDSFDIKDESKMHMAKNYTLPVAAFTGKKFSWRKTRVWRIR